jgi:ribosomal protein L34E
MKTKIYEFPSNPLYIMKTRFSSNAQSCGICLDEISIQGVLSSCKHEFCYHCISKWSEVTHKQIENRCPICKVRFQTLTSEFKRKVYRLQKLKKKVNYVSNKSQKCDYILLTLIETAEQLLTHEIYRLLDSP